jgi:hypothetical protein
MRRSAELERDIVEALTPAAEKPARRAAASQRELFGAAAGILPPAFARSWATQVKVYRKHVADLAEGDQGAFDRAAKTKNKLYKMTNSGEITREAAELLHDHVEGRGEGALPRLGQAEEAGREARHAGYVKAARGLRAEDETLSPHSLLGQLRIGRGR